MSSRQPDAIAAGHICIDLIPGMERIEGELGAIFVPGKLTNTGPMAVTTGGSVSNTGLALCRLGVPTALMGKVGTDVLGRAVLDALRQRDPALADGMIVEPDAHSSYTIVINPPNVDRIFLHCPGANDTFGADDVDYDAVARARLFHFGYPPIMARMFADGGAELAELLRRVRRTPVTTSLDMAWPDPASPAGKADWIVILQRVLPHVDFFLPSLEEILFMLDRRRFEQMEQAVGQAAIARNADAALLGELSERLLAMGAAAVVFKLGDQGLYMRTTQDESRLRSAGRAAPKDPTAWAGREMVAPCFEVNVVGATGAGDCTIAGFLAALLKGAGPEETMTAATAVGACNVEQADATSGVPHWDVVQRRLAAGWPRRGVEMALPGWRHDESTGLWHAPADAAR